MIIAPRTVLFCASFNDEEAINEARSYIKRFSLTPDDVKIIRRDNSITVEAKREFTLGPARDESSSTNTHSLRTASSAL